MKISVSIITGFLGAGKTTFINSLLEKSDNKNIAIIENEFSELGIDSSLIEQQKDNVYELNNGCICCTMSGELEGVLGEIKQQNWDHVIIETTGVADPSPIVKEFFSNPKLTDTFTLDSVTTLVDAQYIFDQINREYETKKQIAFANKIIINKTDTIDSKKKNEIHNKLRSINPDANIISTTYSNIDISNFFNQQVFNSSNIDAIEDSLNKFTFSVLNQQHLNDIQSIPITFEQPISLPKFNFFIQTLLQMKGKDIYRLKGIVNIEGANHSIVFQGIHDSISWNPGPKWEEYDDKKTKIIIIGKNLDKKDIEDGIKNLIEV